MSEKAEELFEAIRHYKSHVPPYKEISDEALREVIFGDERLIEHVYPVLDLARRYSPDDDFPEIFSSLMIAVYEGILMMARQYQHEGGLWENKVNRKMGIDKKGNIFII